MSTGISKKIVLIGAIILALMAITSTVYFGQLNKGLKKSVEAEKLESGRLHYLKSDLEKKQAESKELLAQLQERYNKMERDLADLNKQKLATEARLKKVSKDQKVAAASSKEIADLKKLKADLESQISELNSLLAALKSENEKLNESIASLTKANKELEDKSALLAAMVLDNYRVEASKGKKGKLTITARKTNKLSVGFDLPSGIAENIKFRITTPAGKTIHENDETIGMKVVDNEVLVASLSPLSGQFEVSKRVEMTYKPQERLQSGIYKIDIYNNSTYVGSCQIKLR